MIETSRISLLRHGKDTKLFPNVKQLKINLIWRK
jgi:hypothetical protein